MQRGSLAGLHEGIFVGFLTTCNGGWQDAVLCVVEQVLQRY